MNYKNINSEELKNIQKENAQVKFLDVRTPSEVGQGKIPGAITMDIMNHQFENQIQKLDKDKHYVVYCRSGNRSGQACEILTSMGFKNVNNLLGGIGSWKDKLE